MPQSSRLDDLIAGRRRRTAVTRPAAPPTGGGATSPDAARGGGVANTCRGACWRVATAGARLPAAAVRTQAAAAAPLLVDIETGGFSGTPVFLIGVLDLAAERPACVQFLARDYPEEAAVLQALADLAADRPAWATFNGRSFDEPFLRDRATVHRVAIRWPAEHVDVLHLARRTWRGVAPNFRLTTLEREILGRGRVGDVSGADIPDLFHHFIRTGNAAPLRPVLEHNRLDLFATAELLGRAMSLGEAVGRDR